MSDLIAQLLKAESIQFGAVALIMLAMFFWILTWLLKENKLLSNQNQENTKSFLEQINHQQTKNRKAMLMNTEAITKIHRSVETNNQINKILLEHLKNLK